ncbi:MAG: tetratricopeptide repeat protein [Pseudonocardiaceae bacterium]
MNRKWDEKVGEAVGTAAGWVVGSGIDLAGAAVRNSRDKRMIKAAQAMMVASEAEDSDHFLTVATDFTRRYPREEFGHANLAHALFRKERYDEALTEVDRAVELGLDKWEGHRMRAEIYDESGKTSTAIQEYTYLLQNPSYRGLGLRGRASCLTDLGDFDQALQEADDAVSTLPDENSYTTRGVIYFLMEEFEKCVADFSRAIQLCPSSSDLLAMRADAYEKLGRGDGAQKDRAAAAALDGQAGSAPHPDCSSAFPITASHVHAPRPPATTGSRNHPAVRPAAPEIALIPVLIGALLFFIGLTESGPLATLGLFSALAGVIWYLILSNSKEKE